MIATSCGKLSATVEHGVSGLLQILDRVEECKNSRIENVK